MIGFRLGHGSRIVWRMGPEGWYEDPFGLHEQRWMSDGASTSLVRDRDQEGHDDPPEGPVPDSRFVPAPSVERPAPASAMAALGVNAAHNYSPPRLSRRQLCRVGLCYYIAPPVVVGTAVFLGALIFDARRAVFACLVAAALALAYGACSSAMARNLSDFKEFDRTDFSGDFYPR